MHAICLSGLDQALLLRANHAHDSSTTCSSKCLKAPSSPYVSCTSCHVVPLCVCVCRPSCREALLRYVTHVACLSGLRAVSVSLQVPHWSRAPLVLLCSALYRHAHICSCSALLGATMRVMCLPMTTKMLHVLDGRAVSRGLCSTHGNLMLQPSCLAMTAAASLAHTLSRSCTCLAASSPISDHESILSSSLSCRRTY